MTRLDPTSPAHRRLGRIPAAICGLGLALVLAACGSGTAASPAPSAGAASPAAPVSAAPGAPAALPAEVDVATAASLVEGGAFLLDVRTPEEWAAGHVQGATLVPLDALPGRLSDVPKDRQVVVMCRTGHRSAQGRDILLGAGYPSVTSMAGGITAWNAAGRPTVTGQ
jgi:rhodanese-related sulfurtransferase